MQSNYILEKGGAQQENMGLAMASPLIVQAVEKVDLVVAKLQELQHNISTTRSCLGASQNGRERSKQFVTPNKGRVGVWRKSRQTLEAKRLQETPPPWALQRTHCVIDMRGGKHLPRMKDVLAVEDHDVLALPPAEGEWRRWSEPAGAIHQAVSEILVATQYTKEMAGIIIESLEENKVLEARAAPGGGANLKPAARSLSTKVVAGPPRKVLVRRSQTKSLTEKKIASKVAHKFKGVFPYEGSPDNHTDSARSPQISETVLSPSSQAKRDMCPKAKDIRRPATPKVTGSLVNKEAPKYKDAATRLSGRKGVSGTQETQRSVKPPWGSDTKKAEVVSKTLASKPASGRHTGAQRNSFEVEQIFTQEGNPELKTMPPQATQIKKPWNSSKVVLFSNPTFDPTPKQTKEHTKGWIGRRLSYEGSGLKRLSLGLRSSSAGKNLPTLISALPARRKSVDPSQLKPEASAPPRLSASRGGELPLPPGRLHLQKAGESGSDAERAFQGSAAQSRKPDVCKLKVRDSNVGVLDAGTRGSGQTGATAAYGKKGKCMPSGEIRPPKDSAHLVAEPGSLSADPGSPEGDFMMTPCHEFESPTHPSEFASGKENLVLAGCAPGMNFLRRSWSHGNDRMAALSKSPAGRSLLKRAKGWMSFQEISRRRDSLGRASTQH